MVLELGLVGIGGTLVLRVLVQKKRQSLLQQPLPLPLLVEGERIWQIGDRIEVLNTAAWKGTVIAIEPLTIQLDIGRIIGEPGDGMAYIGESVDFKISRMRRRLRLIIGSYCAICTLLTVAAAMTDRLSPKVGLPWEGYFAMMTLGSLWCLGQAVSVYFCLVTRETQYPIGAFGMGLVATVVPFASEASDTFKDIQFGALCLLPGTPLVLKVVGVVSILYVYAFHEWLLRDRDMIGEVASTYLAIYTAEVESHEDDAQASDILREDAKTSFCVLASQQTSPEKRRLLLIENLPQTVCLVIYSFCMGLHLLPVVSAAGIPIIQYLLALILYDTFRKGASANTFKKLLKLANESELNTAKLGKIKSVLLGDNAALIKYWMTILGDTEKNLLHSAASKLENKGDLDISTVLKMLDGPGNKFEISVYPDILSLVVDFIENNKTVTDMSVSFNAELAAAIMGALKRNHTLTSLSLKSKLGKEAGVLIADYLKDNVTLQTLSLNGNRLGTEGVRSVLDALKVNRTLGRVNLPGNNLGAEACIDAAEVLKINTTLTELNIENNQIGKDGVAAIADALKVGYRQFKLWVDAENIERSGRLSIADALKINSGLTVNLLWSQDDGSGCRVQDPLMESCISPTGALQLARPPDLQDYYER